MFLQKVKLANSIISSAQGDEKVGNVDIASLVKGERREEEIKNKMEEKRA